MTDQSTSHSPDINAAGLTGTAPDALRYDGHDDDPAEVAGMLRAIMPASAKVLDIGCGTGSVTLIANRGKNNRVLAIEPDPERAAVAASRDIDVRCGLVDDAFLRANGPFDVIMLSDVLEHLAAPTDMLATIRAALSPDGAALISVPNVAHWSVRLNLLFGRFDYADVGIMDATHLRWFTARTIRELFERNGFRLEAFGMTAGATLPVYARAPFRWVPARLRAGSIRLLTRLLPNLFGCQFVLRARRIG